MRWFEDFKAFASDYTRQGVPLRWCAAAFAFDIVLHSAIYLAYLAAFVRMCWQIYEKCFP